MLGEESADVASTSKAEGELVEWWSIKPRQAAPPRQTATSPGRQGRFIINEVMFGELRASVAAEIGNEARLPRSTPLLSWATAALAVADFAMYQEIASLQGDESASEFLSGLLLHHDQVLQHGEVWTLLVALFTHSSALQLAASTWGLTTVAIEAEALLGRGTYFAIFLLAGLSGEAAALAVDPSGMSCGPAACLAGLSSALLVQQRAASAAKAAAAAIRPDASLDQTLPAAAASVAPAGEIDIQDQAESVLQKLVLEGPTTSGRSQSIPSDVLLKLNATGSLGLALLASYLFADPQLPALHQLQPLSLAAGAAAGGVLAAAMGPRYQVSREVDIPVGSMIIPQDAPEVVVIVDTRSDVQRFLAAGAYSAMLWLLLAGIINP